MEPLFWSGDLLVGVWVGSIELQRKLKENPRCQEKRNDRTKNEQVERMGITKLEQLCGMMGFCVSLFILAL